jgi:hypothetical protein
MEVLPHRFERIQMASVDPYKWMGNIKEKCVSVQGVKTFLWLLWDTKGSVSPLVQFIAPVVFAWLQSCNSFQNFLAGLYIHPGAGASSFGGIF